MTKTIHTFIFIILLIQITCASELTIVSESQNGHGLLCQSQGKRVLFMSGTPEQMGTAQGEIYKSQIPFMVDKIYTAGGAYTMEKNDWFFSRMEEVLKRTRPYTPKRFITECDAMTKAAGLSKNDGYYVNYFPEMFHCSGFAVRGKATKDGRLLHARVLDYMTSLNLQKYASLMIYMPDKYNNWLSVSYIGFIGTVTAMNEKGLAIGELGGHGEGNWDGMPMSFLLREIMEKASTVEEALQILKNTPRTCEYYYVISDKNKNMVGIYATPDKLLILEPGEQNELLPKVPEDTVLMSGGSRKKHLSDRLHKYYGKIDVPTMIEIIKHPVAMKSNLHNAIFEPETLDIWISDASRKKKAYDNPYAHFNLTKLLEFYKTSNKKKLEHASVQ